MFVLVCNDGVVVTTGQHRSVSSTHEGMMQISRNIIGCCKGCESHQVLHDLRIDVLMVLLNKLQSDYVGDYVGGKNTGSYRGVDNNVLIVL